MDACNGNGKEDDISEILLFITPKLVAHSLVDVI